MYCCRKVFFKRLVFDKDVLSALILDYLALNIYWTIYPLLFSKPYEHMCLLFSRPHVSSLLRAICNEHTSSLFQAP